MMKTLALLALATTPLFLVACDDDHHRHGYHRAYHGDREYVEERHEHDGYRRGTTYRTEREVVVEPGARRVYTTY
jgi:hypothetical protein